MSVPEQRITTWVVNLSSALMISRLRPRGREGTRQGPFVDVRIAEGRKVWSSWGRHDRRP